MCVCVCVCVCVYRITCCTRDREPLLSLKELRAHRDGFMGKAETSHITHPSSCSKRTVQSAPQGCALKMCEIPRVGAVSLRHLYSKRVVTELSAFVEKPCCDDDSSLPPGSVMRASLKATAFFV